MVSTYHIGIDGVIHEAERCRLGEQAYVDSKGKGGVNWEAGTTCAHSYVLL